VAGTNSCTTFPARSGQDYARGTVGPRKKAAIFVLRLNLQNYLGTMDFSRGRIRDAIETGRHDAAGARFEWQYGEPHFLVVR
jgi:hypothetical protein